MVFMALDHASLFIAMQHYGEYWGIPLPAYPNALSMFTRVISHLCAPGFFFLMGCGMHLFAHSRRDRGWSEREILRHFVVRGLVLIVVEVFVVNVAFGIGMYEAIAAGESDPMPGGGVPGILPIGVLSALGAAMVLSGLFLRLGGLATLSVGLGVLIACQALLPSADHGQEVYPVFYHVLLIAGHVDRLIVMYPIAPWFGVCMLGIAYGHALRAKRAAALRFAGPGGLLLLLLFMVVRAIGGFGTHHAAPGDGWIAFLTVTKYPPSLAFLLLSLGTNGVLLWLWAAHPRFLEKQGKALLTLGRTPLFFYVAHLYIYALMGLMYPGASSLPVMYAFWILGIVLLLPACRRYYDFKSTKPELSLWRLF